MAYLTGDINIDIRNATMEKIAAVDPVTASASTLAPKILDTLSPLVGGGLGAAGGLIAQRMLIPEDERNYGDAAIEGFLNGSIGALAARGGGMSSPTGNALLGGLMGSTRSFIDTKQKTDQAYEMLRALKNMNALKPDFKDDPDTLAAIDAYNNELISGVGMDPEVARQRVIDSISF